MWIGTWIHQQNFTGSQGSARWSHCPPDWWDRGGRCPLFSKSGSCQTIFFTFAINPSSWNLIAKAKGHNDSPKWVACSTPGVVSHHGYTSCLTFLVNPRPWMQQLKLRLRQLASLFSSKTIQRIYLPSHYIVRWRATQTIAGNISGDLQRSKECMHCVMQVDTGDDSSKPEYINTPG